MKKNIFTLGLIFCITLSQSGFAQTAKNFHCNDCAGKMHDLYAELDSGYVVVMDFVMPCGLCTAPSKTAYDIVQRQLKINPKMIRFYIADDYGNSSCSVIASFETGMGVSGNVKFSDTSLKESNYSTGGMPKILVIGGKGHQIFYDKNSTLDSVAFKTGITNALSAAGISTVNTSGFSVSPNPAGGLVQIVLPQTTESEIIISDISGKMVLTQSIQKSETLATINTSGMAAGTYIIRIGNQTQKLLIQ